ncbi:hypothetical protein BKA82DRAFT_4329117 [Pisolithus tinctorius]|nr:hypothetical protein BKA82DRAFT_4329117 [Pisolithus tinctorius]
MLPYITAKKGKQSQEVAVEPTSTSHDTTRSTPGERAVLARQIRDACMNVGFFYSRPLVLTSMIFQRAICKKLYHKAVGNFKGYEPLLGSNANPANRGDLHEGFAIGWEELMPKENDEKRVNDGAMAGANVWPLEPAGFREACLNYYHAAVDVGKVLFRLFAIALDLPETYFDDKTRNSAAIMWTVHYPPQTGPEDDGIVGVVAPPIPRTLVINIGDQLARWTNYHVQIKPMPSCVSPERPPRYEPVAAGDYVHQRLQEVYYRNTSTS